MPPSGEAWGPRAAPARKPDSEAQSGEEDARFLDCPVITNYPFWEWPLCLKSHFPPSVVPVFELFVLCTLLKNQNSGPFCCMPVTRHRASGASSRPPWGGRGLSCAPIRRVLVSAGRSARSAWHVSIRRCGIRTSCPPIRLCGLKPECAGNGGVRRPACQVARTPDPGQLHTMQAWGGGGGAEKPRLSRRRDGRFARCGDAGHVLGRRQQAQRYAVCVL